MSGKVNALLRPATKHDIDKIFEWWTNGEIMQSVGYPLGLPIAKKDIEQSLKYYEETDDAAFLIILSEAEKEIGEFAYAKISTNTYTFDIKIGESQYQGKGYGKKALLEGLKMMQKQKDCERIEINVAPENKKALGLYKSVGFKFVHKKEDNWKDQLGNLRSTEVLELTF
ncbi:GNAT family N-acetyltransferase [Enterococcus sp. DIV0876]|uniref:GNAT family N-acetyltransferase n=1 Tax=Enterococcus sp. DIV0876 TaxID=2774633 RepID=UPI003D2FAD59